MLGLSAVLKFSQDRGERYKMVKEADSRVDLPVCQNTLTSCHLVWRVHIQKKAYGKIRSTADLCCFLHNLYKIC